jgi:hypothetical protein
VGAAERLHRWSGERRVRAGGGDVHGAGRPHRHAHVRHLQNHAAQRLRGHGPRRAPGEDRAARLPRGDTSIDASRAASPSSICSIAPVRFHVLLILLSNL